MKRFHWSIAVLLLAMVALLIWWLLPREISEATSTASEGAQLDEGRSLGEVPQQTRGGASLPESSAASIPGDVREYVRQLSIDPLYDWKQPINFYGKVIDENGEPVAGATVHFRWNDLSPEGTSDGRATSDRIGLFSLVDRRGKGLTVTVSKEGYYTPLGARRSFEYANPADGLFVPDRSNPVVFHLRRKGTGTDLVTSAYGMKSYLGVPMPLHEVPVQFDLLERKAGPGGSLRLSQAKPAYENWKLATEWMFRMEIPDGGFIEHSDEFPFEAPASGYQPVVEYRFQVGQTNWTTVLRRKYYVKFGKPSRYGWLDLETMIMMPGARLTYAVNPDGSRYLEPK